MVAWQILRAQWHDVFFLSAEIYAFGAVMFLILGSGEQQWWADGPMKDSDRLRCAAGSGQQSPNRQEHGFTASYGSCEDGVCNS